MKFFAIVLFVFLLCAALPQKTLLADEKSDAELAQVIKDSLLSDSRINNLFLKVSVVEGKAVLSGRIMSAEEKDLAEKIAKETKGVLSVENSLEIKPLGPEDIETLKGMKKKTEIGTFYRGRPASLEEKVPTSYFEREEGESSYAKGLREMNHQMRKNIKEEFSDRDIKARVEEAIRRAPLRGRVDNLTVMVSNGRVTIIGTVNNVFDQQSIRDIASRVPGVVSVDDSTNLNR